MAQSGRPRTTRQLPGPPLDPEADVKSRRRARKWWWATGIIVVGLIVWVLATGGQADRGNEVTAPLDFCKAASRYEKTLERQFEDDGKLTPAEIDEQVALMQVVVDTAPRKVQADALTFFAALQRAQAKGKRVPVTDAEQEAAENVNRRYAQGCAVYKRDGL
jgi:hypothetical protein